MSNIVAISDSIPIRPQRRLEKGEETDSAHEDWRNGGHGSATRGSNGSSGEGSGCDDGG